MNGIITILRRMRRLASGTCLCLAVSAMGGSAPNADLTGAIAHRLQNVHRFELENGLTGLIADDPDCPVVSIQIWIKLGSIHEQEYLGSGISHAIEHMIFKGTDDMPPGMVMKKIHDLGGNINAYTSLDQTVFHTDLPAEHWKTGLQTLAQAVLTPAFPEKEWKKEKDVILREIAMERDRPDSVLDRQLWRTAYATHPYRHPVIGYEDTFRALGVQDLRSFARRHYIPENMMVVLSGRISPQEAEAAIRKLFGAIPHLVPQPAMIPEESPQLSPRQIFLSAPCEVPRMRWAYPAVDFLHPDAPALDLLAELAAGSPGSRFVRHLRDKSGIVKRIESWSFTPQYRGLFGFDAVCDADKIPAVQAAVQAEIGQWAKSGFSRREIERGKRAMLSRMMSQMDTAWSVAHQLGSGELFAHDPKFMITYAARLEQVTASDLKAAVNRYLVSERCTLAVMTPPAATASNVAAPPPIQPYTLSSTNFANGIRWLFREDHRLPTLSICVAMRGGLLDETPAKNGLTRLMSELLVRGTARHPVDAIINQLQTLGATVTPFAEQDAFGLTAHCLAKDAPAVLAIINDCLLNASFPENEVERLRENLAVAAEQLREQPMTVAQMELREMLFQGHPYARISAGTPDVLRRLTRAEVQAYHQRQVKGGNMVVAAIGDLKAPDAQRLFASVFAMVPAGTCAAMPPPEPAAALPCRAKRVEPKSQTVFIAGFPAPGIRDTQRDALMVLQAATSGMTSDYFASIREDRGLAYQAGSGYQAGLDRGYFMLFAATRQDALPTVEELTQKEVDRLIQTGLREDELRRACDRLSGAMQIESQDNDGMAYRCALEELNGAGALHYLALPGRLRLLTVADIQKAAAQVLTTNRMAVSIVLPQ
jgi:zinc protease